MELRNKEVKQWNRIIYNRYILGKGIIKNLKKQTIVMIFLFLINLSRRGAF